MNAKNTGSEIAEKLITYPTFTHRWVTYELIYQHKLETGLKNPRVWLK